MGYTITIGNAEPQQPDDDAHEYTFYVPSLQLPDAPAAPGDVNPHRNYRWPSYSVWAEFARSAGLHDLFFNEEDGLIRPHPAVVVLREHHAATIAGALTAFRLRFPEAVARFDIDDPTLSFAENLQRPEQHPKCDYTLARLEWLDWWVRWALNNCECPAIQNT